MFKKLLLISYFILTIFLPIFVLATDPVATPTCGQGTGKLCFIPAITIPGFLEAGKTIDIDGSSLAQYIVKIYRYGAMFAGVVAMFILVYAGWQWLLAGGNSGKISQARDKINGALIGLILLFGGYILLSLISVNLIQFKPLNTKLPDLKSLCPTFLEKEQCENANCRWVPASALQLRANEAIANYCEFPLAITCPSEAELQDVNIPKLTESNCSDCRLTIDTINKLKIAVAMLNPGESMTIKSAYRTFAKQQELYDCYNEMLTKKKCPASCTDGCNEASKPDCEKSTHMMGIAVDVCITTTPGFDTCNRDPDGDSYLQKKYNCQNASCFPPGMWSAQDRLKTIMVGACFTRYDGPTGEWWHFVANTGPGCEKKL